MAIADELTKLENNRANIVAAINSKGGGLADNAGLAACPEAISQLGNAGGETIQLQPFCASEEGKKGISEERPFI